MKPAVSSALRKLARLLPADKGHQFAVEVIDPRGNELLALKGLEAGE